MKDQKDSRLLLFQDEGHLFVDPIGLFKEWFEHAKSAGEEVPEAMVLATASKDYRVSSRVVLLKEIDCKGVMFFTNYESCKSQCLKENPFASVTFLWKGLQRQVCLRGKVEKVSLEISRKYFESRNRDSCIGAWSSLQSTPLSSREELEKRFEHFREKFAGLEKIPLPPHWGGYLLVVDYCEFWLQGDDRLHDRLCYSLEEKSWGKKWLYP
jgi:pyridoxamine 5'-phosphate oxidase